MEEQAMAGLTKAISEPLYERVKEALSEVSKTGDVSRKLQAIKSAKEHGIKKVSEIFGISRVALMEWGYRFEKEGLEGLKMRSGRGRKNMLSPAEKESVKKWIMEDSNLTIKAIKIRMEALFHKKLSMSATHNLIRDSNFAYITPRAQHYKQDKEHLGEFKKKSKKLTRKQS